MKTLSSRRRLLPRPVDLFISVWWFYGSLSVVAALCWLLASRSASIMLGCLVALLIFGWIVSLIEIRRVRRLAASRPDD